MKKVITYGSFDLFHDGHYKLLKRAKALGDYLIVGVTTEHYDESRGKLNVVNTLMERIENIKNTGFADEILIEDHAGQKIEDILKYNIDVFTVGSDWLGVFDYLKEYCQVVYLERTKEISSTMKRAQNYKIIRLGVIGCGRIADRFIHEAKFVSGINIECVYNPHIESAKSFAQRHELYVATDKEQEFYDMVDAVYIASPHSSHYNYIKIALLNNKHVLCEKPMCLVEKEAIELFSLAKSRQRILMEGIKTAYAPGFVRMLSMAKSGSIGDIRDVEACFTKLTEFNTRELMDVKTGGSFTELASYTMLAIIKLLGLNYEEIRFDSYLAENGVDLFTKTNLKYKKGFAASKVGLGVKSEGQLLISGTKGYIIVEAPWWKTQSFEIRYEDDSQNERYFTKFIGYGLRYEISDFVSLINGYEKSEFKLTAKESIALAKLMEIFLKTRA